MKPSKLTDNQLAALCIVWICVMAIIIPFVLKGLWWVLHLKLPIN